jgi:hypothetical protein
VRRRLGWWLRRLADRIDRPGAPKRTGLTFGYVERVGLVVEFDGPGCPLWYLNDDDRERAYAPGVGGVPIPTNLIHRRSP